MISKKRKLGKTVTELTVGDRFSLKTKVEDKDILLYLGLTEDANPLYIQHDYASQTPYKRPLVPTVMLYGIVTSLVSTHLPGPGSHITKHTLTFPEPLYHYEEITTTISVKAINEKHNQIFMDVISYNEKNEVVIEGELEVRPPYKLQSLVAKSLENFH